MRIILCCLCLSFFFNLTAQGDLPKFPEPGSCHKRAKNADVFDTLSIEYPIYLGEDISEKKHVKLKKIMTHSSYTGWEYKKPTYSSSKPVYDLILCRAERPSEYITLPVINKNKLHEFPDSLIAWKSITKIHLVQSSKENTWVKTICEPATYNLICTIHDLVQIEEFRGTNVLKKTEKIDAIHRFQYKKGFLDSEFQLLDYGAIITPELIHHLRFDFDDLNPRPEICNVEALPLPKWDTTFTEVLVYIGGDADTHPDVKFKRFKTKPAKRELVKIPNAKNSLDSIYTIRVVEDAEIIELPVVKKTKAKKLSSNEVKLTKLQIIKSRLDAPSEQVDAICEITPKLINMMYESIYGLRDNNNQVFKVSLKERLQEIYKFQEELLFVHAHSYDNSGKRLILPETLDILNIY